MVPDIRKFHREHIKNVIAAAAMTTLVIALAGCSGGSSTASAGTKVVESARAALPKEVRSSGILKMASSFDYGPYDYIDASSGSMTGFDYAVVNDMANRMGLKTDWTNLGQFESLIPAVQSGKVDAITDGMSIIDARIPSVSFVYNVKADVAILTQAGNPDNINPKNLCGDHLTTAPGSVHDAAFKDLSAKCVAAGKPAIKVQYISDPATGTAAVLSGQVQGEGYSTATGAFAAKANPKLGVTAAVPGYATPAGIVVQKSAKGEAVGKAMAIALNTMVADGTLRKIALKYGFTENMLPSKSMLVSTSDQLHTLLTSDASFSNASEEQ